jgi:hypothetical protein
VAAGRFISIPNSCSYEPFPLPGRAVMIFRAVPSAPVCPVAVTPVPLPDIADGAPAEVNTRLSAGILDCLAGPAYTNWLADTEVLQPEQPDPVTR